MGIRAGLQVEEFWSLTPYEFGIVVEARQEQGNKERIQQAWLIAALVWQKKLPKLEKLLNTVSKPKTYTQEEIADMYELHQNVIHRMKGRKHGG